MNPKLAPPFEIPAPRANGAGNRRTVSYWQLGTQITGGRWFEIYRAAPKSLAEQSAFDYAIKLVNPHLSRSQSLIAYERLGREAAAADSVQHRGIIPLLDAELDQPEFFLVQPWIAGGTLDKFVATAKDISLVRCLWIVRQIAEAIAAAHDRQRVYLGLDPAHVLLGSGGRVMLIGWANSHVEGQPLSVPTDQFRFAQYSAPECFGEHATAQAASDVFSLGVFIYQLLANVMPYRPTTVKQLILARQHKRPIDVIRRQPACPPRLSRLASEMMSVQSEARPAIRDVLEQLIAIEIENLENPTLIRL